MKTQVQRAGMGWGKKKEEEVNGTELGEMNGGGAGESGREMELLKKWEERHERRGADGPSLGGLAYSSRRGDLWVCLQDSGLGCPLLRGGEGTGSAKTTPPSSPPPHPCRSLRWQQLLPLAGGVGRRVPVTTSPRLELELSPDLLCGQRGKRSCEQRGGREGGGSLFPHRLPAPHSSGDSPAPLVRPQAAVPSGQWVNP